MKPIFPWLKFSVLWLLVLSPTPAGANENTPFLYLAFISDSHSAWELSDIVNRSALDPVRNLEGVAGVVKIGEQRQVTRLRLDMARLVAYGFTVQRVVEELAKMNVQAAVSRIQEETYVLKVSSMPELGSPQDLGNIVLAQLHGVPVRLKDVSVIEIAAEDGPLIARYDGRRVVALGIMRQPGANPLWLLARMVQVLPKIQAVLPLDIRLIILDTSLIEFEPHP